MSRSPSKGYEFPLQLREADPDPVTGWATYRVYSGTLLIGLVVEWHRWDGAGYGPREWIGCYNPGAIPDQTVWASEPQPSTLEALGRLAGYLVS